MPARATASRTTIAPSSGAVKSFKRAEKLSGRKTNGTDDKSVTHNYSDSSGFQMFQVLERRNVGTRI